jgi:hypothetical protein
VRFAGGVVLLALVVGDRSAAADGFVELFGGRATPIADRDYNSRFEDGEKLGIRFGIGTARAIEAGVDVSPIDDPTTYPSLTYDASRVRVLGGARLAVPIGSPVNVYNRVVSAHVFGRVAAGVDLVHVNAARRALFGPLEERFVDIGLAVELGAGLMLDFGRFSIGAQVALPVTYHFREADFQAVYYPGLDYTGVELDLLLAIALRF